MADSCLAAGCPAYVRVINDDRNRRSDSATPGGSPAECQTIRATSADLSRILAVTFFSHLAASRSPVTLASSDLCESASVPDTNLDNSCGRRRSPTCQAVFMVVQPWHWRDLVGAHATGATSGQVVLSYCLIAMDDGLRPGMGATAAAHATLSNTRGECLDAPSRGWQSAWHIRQHSPHFRRVNMPSVAGPARLGEQGVGYGL